MCNCCSVSQGNDGRGKGEEVSLHSLYNNLPQTKQWAGVTNIELGG